MELNYQIIGNLTQATSKHPDNDEAQSTTLQRHQLKLPKPLPLVKLTNRRYLGREDFGLDQSRFWLAAWLDGYMIWVN